MTTECWLCSEAIDPDERTAKLAGQLPVHRRCLSTDANGTFGFERALSPDDTDAPPPSVAA